jgi:ATP-dependent Clp protease ATP-binding subunit ClpB
MFKPLTKDNISGIIQLIIADLNNRLADRDIGIELTDEAVRFIADNAYDPVYGARPLKRYIQKYVETLSARLILEDRLETGDTIMIVVKDNELSAEIKKP